jgi:putative FmdB family regulatory protein
MLHLAAGSFNGMGLYISIDERRVTMPLFEYKCEHCSEKFELIKSASDLDAVMCPSCGNIAQKQLSVFAKPSAAPSAGASFNRAPKGGCGNGSCGSGGCGF